MDAEFSTRKSLFPRGGARRKTGEPSDALTYPQCRSLLDAAARADRAGLPFNRFITILWERNGLSEEAATAATRAWIKLAGYWFAEHGSRFAWADVHERGSVNGAHVHILLHVPPKLKREFRAKPLRWAKAVLPQPYMRKTVRSHCILGADAPDGISRESYAFNLDGKLHYMVKTAPLELEHELGLATWGRSRWGPKGRI